MNSNKILFSVRNSGLKNKILIENIDASQYPKFGV